MQADNACCKKCAGSVRSSPKKCQLHRLQIKPDIVSKLNNPEKPVVGQTASHLPKALALDSYPTRVYSFRQMGTPFLRNIQKELARDAQCGSPKQAFLIFYLVITNKLPKGFYMILRNSIFMSSTLAARGFPGAQASAKADSAKNDRSSSRTTSKRDGIPTSSES